MWLRCFAIPYDDVPLQLVDFPFLTVSFHTQRDIGAKVEPSLSTKRRLIPDFMQNTAIMRDTFEKPSSCRRGLACQRTATERVDFRQMPSTRTDVMPLLERLRGGDRRAADDLLHTLYDDLRRVAAVKLAGERSGHSLQPTELVHEAYLRLVRPDDLPNWNSRGHFFTAAAEAMRRILIDHARKKKSQKSGGGQTRISLADQLIPDQPKAEKLLALEEALVALEKNDAKKAALVKLRFFAGFTIEEAAGLLDISTTTADRHWAYARAWLKTRIDAGLSNGL